MMNRRALEGAQNKSALQGQDQGSEFEKHPVKPKGRFWNRPKTNLGGRSRIKTRG